MLAAAFACGLAACARIAPDTVLLNGKVFTANPAQPWAQAVAIRGDRVIAVGSSTEIDSQAGSATRRFDLQGRTVVPGFNDAHLHVAVRPAGFGLVLGDDPSAADLETTLVEAQRKASPGEPLRGSVGARILDDPSIDRAWLDARVAGDRPVMLSTAARAGVILNSAGLALAQIDESIGDPEGGRFFRDASGKLNGRVEGYGTALVWRRLAARLPKSETVAAYRRVSREAARYGVTSIQLMNDGQPQSKTIADLLEADSPLRWRLMRFPIREAGQELTDGRPILPPQPAPRIDGRGMTWLLDGPAIERRAALREPYRDSQSAGSMNLAVDRLRMVVGWAYGSEDPLAMHAVGDAAIDAYFTALEAAGRPETWRLKRPRLEHGDMLFPDLIARAKTLGVVVVQTPSSFSRGEALVSALGQVRRWNIQPLKSLVAAGVALAFGSDGPLNPCFNIRLATTHRDRPSEALTREQAVTAYTRGSAFAEFMEEEKGHLTPGALADLAVLSADVFEAPETQLPSIESVLTLVGGRIVHDAQVVSRRLQFANQ